ncbi:hypothetical protein FRZ03_35270 [Streptomyces misionensis]|uniref:Lipoprotein n=1 Tax=Streptomyces misionensis TaxID=67331 RepID=A0A5C6IQD8_9ACTN|nr:hypothetical protein [Streptomyces misionensis]TWV31224.1 hypothetical protein FRZ03_35270 [Streptomyces misionensis]
MTMRRTFRSAGLVAVAAAAALSLAACQSGGKDAASGPERQVSAAGSTGHGAAPGGSATIAADKAPAGVRTGTNVAHRGGTPVAGATSASTVRTQKLPDGSTAEIRRLGEQHYVARIVHDGSVLATLETNGADAGLDANDMFIVLTLGGQVHAWMGGGHQGPGTFKLAGGWTAKVTKRGELRYRAQILGNDGSVDATLETNQHDVGLDANGVYIVLSAGGVISAHE